MGRVSTRLFIVSKALSHWTKKPLAIFTRHWHQSTSDDIGDYAEDDDLLNLFYGNNREAQLQQMLSDIRNAEEELLGNMFSRPFKTTKDHYISIRMNRRASPDKKLASLMHEAQQAHQERLSSVDENTIDKEDINDEHGRGQEYALNHFDSFNLTKDTQPSTEDKPFTSTTISTPKKAFQGALILLRKELNNPHSSPIYLGTLFEWIRTHFYRYWTDLCIDSQGESVNDSIEFSTSMLRPPELALRVAWRLLVEWSDYGTVNEILKSTTLDITRHMNMIHTLDTHQYPLLADKVEGEMRDLLFRRYLMLKSSNRSELYLDDPWMQFWALKVLVQGKQYLNCLPPVIKKIIDDIIEPHRHLMRLQEQAVSKVDQEIHREDQSRVNVQPVETSLPAIIDHLPPVKEIETKGQGVRFIRAAMLSLKGEREKEDQPKHPTAQKNSDKELSLIELQNQLESDCLATAMALKETIEHPSSTMFDGGASKDPLARQLISQLREQLTRVYHRELYSDIQEADVDGSIEEYPDLTKFSFKRPVSAQDMTMYRDMVKKLNASKLASIVLHELLQLNKIEPLYQGYKASSLSEFVGTLAYNEVWAEQAKDIVPLTSLRYENLSKILNGKLALTLNIRRVHEELQGLEEQVLDQYVPPWSSQQKILLGSFLVALAIKHLHFKYLTNNDEWLPFLEHQVVRQQDPKRRHHLIGMIFINPLVMPILRLANKTLVYPICLPMLVPPKPWLTLRSGGYLNRSFKGQLPAVRQAGNQALQKVVLKHASNQGYMRNVLYGLDILGKTPWIINQPILSLCLHFWNDLGLDLVTLQPKQSTRAPPLPPRKQQWTGTEEDFKNIYKKWFEDSQTAMETLSQLSDIGYKLEIARMFAGRVFYFPHSVDFRGRAYPIPPHLNQISNDLSRGLLLFAEGKPLGPRGFFWLAVHAANMYGQDKLSRADKIIWVNKHKQLIIEAASTPTQVMWWRAAEEPWQFLAACFELNRAWNSSDPETVISHLPIQQDGTCNGLQHYAALGGDEEGAVQVNLTPSRKPQDVYATVALKIQELIQKELDQVKAVAFDVKRGFQSFFLKQQSLRGVCFTDTNLQFTPISLLLASIAPRLNRKIVKQPVMTKVYGVTLFGAKRQIEEALVEYKVLDQLPSKVIDFWTKVRGDLVSEYAQYKDVNGASSVSPEMLKVLVTKESIDSVLGDLSTDVLVDTPLQIKRELLPLVSAYIATRVMYTLSSMFSRAQAIQDWFTRTAKDIVHSVPLDVALAHGYVFSLNDNNRDHGKRPLFAGYKKPWQVKGAPRSMRQDSRRIPYPQTPLIWTSPLGMLVCQPYAIDPCHAPDPMDSMTPHSQQPLSSLFDQDSVDQVRAELQSDRDDLARCIPVRNAFNPKSSTLRTCIQSMTLTRPASPEDPIDAKKQVLGFPPNYIHSLDATHMFMTAIACHESSKIDGDDFASKLSSKTSQVIDLLDQVLEIRSSHTPITFTSVHDSFWTHACTVDDMNRILREQFVKLYEKNSILQSLADELRTRYRDYKIPVVRKRSMSRTQVHMQEISIRNEFLSEEECGSETGWVDLVIEDPPKRGDLDLKCVLESDYFFG